MCVLRAASWAASSTVSVSIFLLGADQLTKRRSIFKRFARFFFKDTLRQNGAASWKCCNFLTVKINQLLPQDFFEPKM